MLFAFEFGVDGRHELHTSTEESASANDRTNFFMMLFLLKLDPEKSKDKKGCEAQFTTSEATRVVSFFVLPTRLADGLEAKNLLLLVQIRPCVLLSAKLWFPRVVFNNFGNLIWVSLSERKRKWQENMSEAIW